MLSDQKCAGSKQEYRKFLFKQLLWTKKILSKQKYLKSQLNDFWVVWLLLMILLDITLSKLASIIIWLNLDSVMKLIKYTETNLWWGPGLRLSSVLLLLLSLSLYKLHDV